MKKIMIVFGTRPEAIKMIPLVKELEKDTEFDVIICATGQHRQMLDQVMDVFHITPQYDLNIMKERQTLFDITSSMLLAIKDILKNENPDLVLVHGDTSTAFVTALASYYLRIPVGHVEAGLRTNNIYSPFPEEFNRQAISLISNYHFAPTEEAKINLLMEGKKADTIFVTGNTAIDTLKLTISNDYTNSVLKWANKSRLIMLTAHRRENIGKTMECIFTAIRKIVDETKDVKVIYPVHLNPQIREIANRKLGNHERIKLIEPLDVLAFHNILARCYLVLTDSGGIQEEASALGKPVLVMRDTTERNEGIEAGTIKLIGIEENNIYKEVIKLLTDSEVYKKMSEATSPYGNGFASKRIIEILKIKLKWK